MTAAPCLDLEGFARALATPAAPPAARWRATLVRLAPGDAPRLDALCREYGLTTLDTLERQLAELAAARLPAGPRAGRDAFVARALAASGGAEALGVWAYFPWRGTVVHLLEPDDYFDVVTDRNREKVTREEQRRLRDKCVGVLGLSVGGEAAVTLAQEHLCGRLVLADFDRLDLSNLNRLGAGVDDLGVPKTTIVARRVALLDPFLDVAVIDAPVTAATADALVRGLDLLVEECDAPDVKLAVRERARALGVNVVYAADERGFLSVEPYARRPELPAFHGLVASAPPREAYATPAEFLRGLTEWLGGWDAISERSRRSLAHAGDSIGGYPQLAGEARLAAAQVAHVARRLLLDEPLAPFHGAFDLETLLPTD